MDYDWKYFLEDLKKGKVQGLQAAEGRAAAGDMFYRLPENTRGQLRNLVKTMLAGYRQQEGTSKAMVEELMEAHAGYCRMQQGNEATRRRHNTMVYRYMMKTMLHSGAVAVKMGVSKKTVCNDINKAMDEIMVLCFGLPAVGDHPETCREGVKSLLRNYRLLRQSECISGKLIWENRERERAECRRRTRTALESMEKMLQIYEGFVADSSFPEMQGRRLEELRGFYLAGSSISDLATAGGVSEDTVYADVNLMIGRLAELLEVITGHKCGL